LSEISSAFLATQYPPVPTVKKDWRILLTHNEIILGVRSVAAMLNERFKDDKIVLTAILKGAYLFLSDLAKLLTIPYTVYFVEASSYGDGQVQGEHVELLSRLVPSKFHNRKVVLIDELFDRGHTMHSIKTKLLSEKELGLKESDISSCVLFAKDMNLMPLPDFVGIRGLPNIWLVGYGLDDHGEKRGWVNLYGCPKAAGVPLVAADDIFGTGPRSESAIADIRTMLLNQFSSIEQKLQGDVAQTTR